MDDAQRTFRTTRGSKTDAERGPIGAWFTRAIGFRSIEQVAEDMAARGHEHTPAYYRGIMSGAKKPGRALLQALTEYLGSAPETLERGSGNLVAEAIDRQTRVIQELVDLLKKPAPPLWPEQAAASALEEGRRRDRALAHEVLEQPEHTPAPHPPGREG